MPSSRIAKAASPNATRSKTLPQSELEHRFDLLNPAALYEMTHVLYTGALKYGDENWKNIPVESHLNHLLAHVYAYLSGDVNDHHLANIMCRAMFAQAVALEEADE
jgi:hypothetical protein